MGNPTSILSALKKGMPIDTTLLIGKVTKAKPLTIQLLDESKLSIGESLLTVPEHLTDHYVKVSIETNSGSHSGHESGNGSHNHENVKMKMYDALKAGETVYILSLEGGNHYVIVGRYERKYG